MVKRIIVLLIGILMLSGCTAKQQAQWLNFELGYDKIVVCYWNAQNDRSYANEQFTEPCNAEAGQQLNIVTAINQDDDKEAHQMRCDDWGGNAFGVLITQENNAFREEWVCYKVDF